MSKVVAALSSALFVALHAIHYTDDANKRRVANPGEPFYPPEADVAFLTSKGAVRKANEAEIALYEKQNPVAKESKAKGKPKAPSGESAGSGDGADTSGGGSSNDSLV